MEREIGERMRKWRCYGEKEKTWRGRVSHALVDTRFECGLRLPKALRACEWFECRTRFECLFVVHPILVHPFCCTSYFWCFLSLRFCSFICGSLHQCVLFQYIILLFFLPIFEVHVPKSVVPIVGPTLSVYPMFGVSYFGVSYLCQFLSLCYSLNGVAPVMGHYGYRSSFGANKIEQGLRIVML